MTRLSGRRIGAPRPPLPALIIFDCACEVVDSRPASHKTPFFARAVEDDQRGEWVQRARSAGVSTSATTARSAGTVAKRRPPRRSPDSPPGPGPPPRRRAQRTESPDPEQPLWVARDVGGQHTVQVRVGVHEISESGQESGGDSGQVGGHHGDGRSIRRGNQDAHPGDERRRRTRSGRVLPRGQHPGQCSIRPDDHDLSAGHRGHDHLDQHPTADAQGGLVHAAQPPSCPARDDHGLVDGAHLTSMQSGTRPGGTQSGTRPGGTQSGTRPGGTQSRARWRWARAPGRLPRNRRRSGARAGGADETVAEVGVGGRARTHPSRAPRPSARCRRTWSRGGSCSGPRCRRRRTSDRRASSCPNRCVGQACTGTPSRREWRCPPAPRRTRSARNSRTRRCCNRSRPRSGPQIPNVGPELLPPPHEYGVPTHCSAAATAA